MSRGVVAIVVTLGLAVGPAPAADDQTLQAKDFEFVPPQVTIQPGDTVTFTIDPSSGNVHNFKFEDGTAYPANPSPPGSAWNGQQKTFTTAGTYSFVCGAHAFMTGVVTVQPAAATPTPTPTSTPTPTAEVRQLRMAASSFCTKRGKRCRRPGVRVQIDLSAPAEVSGTLKRRGKRFGRVGFGTVAAGARTLRFTKNATGRRLTSGRYVLRLSVAGDVQPALRFRVR